MFSVKDRERVRDHVLALAASDGRVVAGAVVGSLALDEGDRWSDLDLTFAIADGIPLADVLDDWTRKLVGEFDAAQLFDLPNGPSIYRVFVLPGCLQFDLSFTPASQFGATGPKFKLLFGQAVERPFAEPPAAEDMFGYAVHHALRARFCIERGRFWHAEYWISGVRDYALSLACRRRALPTSYGRGFDDLPPEVRDPFRDALVRSLDSAELLRALHSAIAGLMNEGHQVQALVAKLAPQLRALTALGNMMLRPPEPSSARCPRGRHVLASRLRGCRSTADQRGRSRRGYADRSRLLIQYSGPDLRPWCVMDKEEIDLGRRGRLDGPEGRVQSGAEPTHLRRAIHQQSISFWI